MRKRFGITQGIVLVIILILILFLIYLLRLDPSQESAGKKASAGKGAESVKSAEEILAGMTLREKIYQMFLVSPEQITGVETVTAAGETTRKALQDYPVGGILYAKKNLRSPEQIRTVIENSQSYSRIPLFIAVDEEGGVVNRLMDALGTTYVDSMYLYKDEGKSVAQENASTIASDMKALGFNLDFAPVADVWSNPDNAVIAKRAYSDDFGQAADLVGAAVKGFHEKGVLCTLKHFPGHGDTAQDTQTGIAYVTKTLKELEKEEFSTFREGIGEGADLVMVGHLMVEDIDDTYPASLSSRVIQEILREELHFEGLVITDSLTAQALADSYQPEEIAVLAVKAGNDILLQPPQPREAAQAIQKAVENGEIELDRIDESVLRILQKKLDSGIIQ